MSLSARTPTTLDTNKFIPEIYEQKIVDSAKSNLVAWDAFKNAWTNTMKKGDTFYFRKTNEVTGTEVVVGTKASALNPFNTTAVTLSIDQWFEAPVDIDVMSDSQSDVAMEATAVTEGSYAINKLIDTSVCTLFSSLGGYSTSGYGSDGQTLVDDILIYLKETLDENDVPMVTADRCLIVDPSGLADMLKIDKLLSADYIKIGAVANGVIGNSVYGCVVRVTNNLVAASTGAYGVMAHRNAIVGKAQIQKSWMWHYLDLHQVRYQAEALWGVVELQDTFGVPFFTRKA